MDFISGEIISIDKPLGWTSFDAVKSLRGAVSRRLGLKKVKVGHAGTLDPLATGVLTVCFGRATKRIDELQAGRKEYIATLRLGATTPSFDLEKQIDALYPWEHITEEQVHGVLKDFTGRIMQVPPVFSAVKIDGRRAYNLARKGETPELKAKPLQIDEMELLQFRRPVIRVRNRDLSRSLTVQEALDLIHTTPLEFPEDFPIPEKCRLQPIEKRKE